MNFSWARTVRRNLWVFTPGELSITLLLSVFFLLALGAFLSGRPGAGLALSAAFLYVLIWLGWMLYAALRQMPPFGRFGHLQRIMPLAGLALCFSLSGLLILRLHLSLSEALFYGQSQDSVDRGVSFWTGTLQGHAFLAGLFCLFFLGFFAWLLGLWAFH